MSLSVLRTTGSAAADLVEGVADEQRAAPTPCAGFTVTDLLQHLDGVVGMALAAAGAEAGPAAGAGFRERVAALADAWEGVGDQVVFAGSPMPAGLALDMTVADLVVHGWDLAVATGRPYRPDEAGIAAVERLMEQMGEMGRSMKLFDEPVPVAPDAPRLDRALASTGRDPQWSAMD